MKILFQIVSLLLLPILAYTQQSPGQLKRSVEATSDEAMRHSIYLQLYDYYKTENQDSAMYYAEQCIVLAVSNNRKLSEANSLTNKGHQLMLAGKFVASLNYLQQALDIATNSKAQEDETWLGSVITNPLNGRLSILSETHFRYAQLMERVLNEEQQIAHLKKSRALALEIGDKLHLIRASVQLGKCYIQLNQLDSAYAFEKEAEFISKEAGLHEYKALNFALIGDIILKQGDDVLARKYFFDGLESATHQRNQSDILSINRRLIYSFIASGEQELALEYALKNLSLIQSIMHLDDAELNKGLVYEDLAQAYKLTLQPDSTSKYLELALAVKESASQAYSKNLSEFQKLFLENEFQLKNLEQEKRREKIRLTYYGLLSGLLAFGVIGFLWYTNRKLKSKIRSELL